MKSFKEKNNTVEAYHYSHAKFHHFDPSFLHGGHDQKGPGLYTSSERETQYGPHGHKLTLDTSKFIKPGQKVNRKIVHDLVKKSPHLETQASNWHEHPATGAKMMTDHIVKFSPDMHEAMEKVWYDAYNADNHAFLEHAGEHFHGTIVKPNKFQPSITHYVVWHPKAIKRIEHE